MATLNNDQLATDTSHLNNDEKFGSKNEILHLEDTPHDADWNAIRNDAIIAEGIEHSMSIPQALIVYRSAILWSAAISLVIVMDGYDTGRKYLRGKLQKTLTWITI